MGSKNVLLFGAGRSSIFLIEYLLRCCSQYDWRLTIAEKYIDHLSESILSDPNLKILEVNIEDSEEVTKLVNDHDFVISMLPASYHILIAKECLNCGKPFANASYVTEELKELEPELIQKGFLFAGELGLDPGLDHMSAMETIHRLKDQGAEIYSFTSFTGGLVAPESDDNPWHYKISWNPKNIVMAGNGMAQFKSQGQIVYIPYHQLFRRKWDIEIPGEGDYDGYANRDSLHYEELYELHNVETLVRGTLRYSGFCEAWDILVQSGMTNDVVKIDTDQYSIMSIFNMFFKGLSQNKDPKEIIKNTIGRDISDEAVQKLLWLDIFSEEKLNRSLLTPAEILEAWLIRKWVLKPGDKDMVIMQHAFEYRLNGKNYELTSTLIDKGQDEIKTSMARLVGLPLAIYTKNYLLGKIKGSGFKIPVKENIYAPILEELKHEGIFFTEQIKEL